MTKPHLTNPPRFRFSPDWREAEVLLEVPLIPGHRALVTGSRDGSTCDWLLVAGDRCLGSSDDGFGNVARALYDALSMAHSQGIL